MGIAIDTAFQCSSYRKDLMTESNPKSWVEVFALANQIKSQLEKCWKWHYANPDSLVHFCPLASQFGGSHNNGFNGIGASWK